MEKPQFIYFIEPVRAEMPEAPTPEEAEAVSRHFQYLQAAEADGKLILAGRTLEPPYIGIAIFEAESLSAAQAFAQSDPAVMAGVFRLTSVQPYRVALMRN